MAQPVGTPIRCPQCGQPFSAVLEQIIDVGRDPQAKVRLLTGRANAVACPYCGARFAVKTPLMYHDPAKELLIAFVPMELNLPNQEQERVIGDMQRRLMDSLPPEQRRGYLFTPRRALTLQGLLDQVLEADGITAEVRQQQQAKMQLIQTLVNTPEDQLPALVQAHDAEIDDEFFQLLVASIQVMAQQGQTELAQKMTALNERLVALSSTGREIVAEAQRQDEATRWASDALKALGASMTREQLADLVLSVHEDEYKVEALAALAWPAMDYSFFAAFTERLERRPALEQERLAQLREKLLEMTAYMEQQNRAVIQRAVNTLNAIMAANDVDAALREHLDEIDDMFMSVLTANLRRAEQQADLMRSAKLRQIYERVMALIQEGAPPEVQFLNALMNAPDSAAAEAVIRERSDGLNAAVIDLMDALIDDLKAQGHSEPADRLHSLRGRVAEAVRQKA